LPASPRSIDWILKQTPGEIVRDGGPARCRRLDDNCLAKLTQKMGATSVDRLASENPGGSHRFLEADWVATDQALHYVHFNAGEADSWRWNAVQGAGIGRRGLVFAKVRIRLQGAEPVVLSLGRRAAKALVAIVAECAGTGSHSS
jgi:hypothetical protein